MSILWPMMRDTKFSKSPPKYSHSGQKCTLLLGQGEIVLVVVWSLSHFTLKSTPSMNCVWIVTFVGHLHV